MSMVRKPPSLHLALIVLVGLVASGCAEEFADPTATFDGSVCTFTGPSDLGLNERPPFVFRNESDIEAGMGVWKVPDRMTIEDIAAGDIFEIADFDTDMRGVVETPAGGSTTISAPSDPPCRLSVRKPMAIACSFVDC